MDRGRGAVLPLRPADPLHAGHSSTEITVYSARLTSFFPLATALASVATQTCKNKTGVRLQAVKSRYITRVHHKGSEERGGGGINLQFTAIVRRTVEGLC